MGRGSSGASRVAAGPRTATNRREVLDVTEAYEDRVNDGNFSSRLSLKTDVGSFSTEDTKNRNADRLLVFRGQGGEKQYYAKSSTGGALLTSDKSKAAGFSGPAEMRERGAGTAREITNAILTVYQDLT